jgi:hypothetical protein
MLRCLHFSWITQNSAWLWLIINLVVSLKVVLGMIGYRFSWITQVVLECGYRFSWVTELFLDITAIHLFGFFKVVLGITGNPFSWFTQNSVCWVF